LEQNHNFNGIEENMSILHICHKSQRMNVLEEFEIYKGFKTTPGDVLNDQLQFRSNPVYSSMLKLQRELQGNREGSGSDDQLDRRRQDPTSRQSTGLG